MNFDSEQSALEQASADTVKWIWLDHDQAKAQLKPLFRWLSDYLFDPSVTVARWLLACGVRDKLIPTQFRLQYGVSLQEYIYHCRIDTALRLFLNTNFSASRIGDLVGFPTPAQFTAVFKRQVGIHPKRCRRKFENIGVVEASFMANSRELGAFLAGKRTALLPLFLDRRERQECADALAEMIWSRIVSTEPVLRRRLIRLQVLPQPAFYRLLLKKAREAGRSNLKDRVELAELALASLESPSPSCEVSDYRTEAWAWVATARRLAFDLRGAWHALECGENEWNTPRKEQDMNAYADLLQSRADYFCFRREFSAAKTAIDEAIDIYKLRAGTKLAQALLVRGTILAQALDIGSPFPDFGKAYNLIAGKDESFLECAIVSNMARCCVLMNDLDGVHHLLPLLESKVTEKFLGTNLEYHCEWLKGLSCYTEGNHLDALEHLTSAHRGLVELQELEHVAMISLDTAIVLLAAGKNLQALEIVEEGLRIFSALSLDTEDFASLILVEEALTQEAIFSARRAFVSKLHERFEAAAQQSVKASTN